jgi:hypothetical protein
MGQCRMPKARRPKPLTWRKITYYRLLPRLQAFSTTRTQSDQRIAIADAVGCKVTVASDFDAVFFAARQLDD